MAEDRQYSSKNYLYRSRGLAARWELDRVPEYYYLNMLNCQERDEESMSSRYGTTIINRDPDGTPAGQNYFFSSPVTSLAKATFQNQAYRYAGLANGTLWQRTGNLQGPYTQIAASLSGQPFQTIVTSCFETAQPYLFIYDQARSVKIAVGSSTPELTGIDPPALTADTQPFAPLLTLIDNFASGNSYSASGFDGGGPWTYAGVTTITAAAAAIITDFNQFYSGTANNTTTALPATATSSLSSPGVSPTNVPLSFPSAVVSATTTVILLVALQSNGAAFTGSPTGSASVSFSYTLATSGVTTTIASFSYSAAAAATPTQYFLLNITGITNINQITLTVNATVFFTSRAGTGTITASGTVTAATVLVPTSGVFGSICNGILSVLNSNTSVNIPIASAVSTAGSTSLLVTTQQPHGLTAGRSIALYGTTNPLLDGYYTIATVPSATQFTVTLLSTSLYDGIGVSATGGVVVGGATAPAVAVLTDEYTLPYPAQFSAWGFYQQVPTTTTSFPIGAWSGKVAVNTSATVAVTANFDLSYANQVNDFDLIVMPMKVSAPANIASIKLQFDVNGSGYSSSYYTATISPAYYQGSIANQISAYQATQNQILADALGLISGQTIASTTAQLQPSNFSTGSGSWTAVLIPRGNFLPVGSAGQSGLDWSNITGWRLVIQTSTTAVTGDGSSTVAVNGLYLQWGYGPSSFAGVGYDWRYTYYNEATGTESSPSPIQQFSQQYGFLASKTAPFYLRQASQVRGYYSNDPQVTHVRLYRRGGIYGSNWFQTQQFPNVSGIPGIGGLPFSAKDVTPDATLSQAKSLELDNDPPVTSTLVTPINTTLAAGTISPGQTYYALFIPQLITVADATVTFVQNQVVLVGNAYNLEEVLVVAGGTGQFTAVLRLQHNAGETVSATSIPRQPCSLVALSNQGGVTQVWLAGDPANPHYLYRSKPGYPESFSPADYLPVSSPDDPIVAVINWRGTIVVGTLKTWYIVVGGAKPYPQPTGSQHGIVASQGWVEGEGTIFFRATDGLRVFVGADGEYLTLPVEWVYRDNALTPVPLADLTEASQDILVYFQNQVFASYISQSGGGQRYRLVWDTNYKRFRNDDIPATAMLWEKDTNQLLVGVQVGPASASNFAIALDQQYTKDYDDGGWVGTGGGATLAKTPINLTIQTPYRDLGAPHFPKQWNMFEGDYNTQGQQLQTTLLFKGEQDFSLALPAVNTGGVREKIQFQITQPPSASNVVAGGVEAYSMAIQHTMAVTVAPTLYQENLYAEGLADLRTSYDTYVQKFGTDLLKLVKDAYFDYTAGAGGQLTVSVYADGSSVPYWVDSTTLIAQSVRATVRVILPARKCRLWRMTVVSTVPFKLWAPATVEVKQLQEGSGYSQYEFPVYMSGQEGVQSQG